MIGIIIFIALVLIGVGIVFYVKADKGTQQHDKAKVAIKWGLWIIIIATILCVLLGIFLIVKFM